MRESAVGGGGIVVETRADEFFAVFTEPGAALDAAIAIQRDLRARSWADGVTVRVRIGIHSGEPTVTDSNYIGMDVHAAARICAAAHGGQIVVSSATRQAALRTTQTTDPLPQPRGSPAPWHPRADDVVPSRSEGSGGEVPAASQELTSGCRNREREPVDAELAVVGRPRLAGSDGPRVRDRACRDTSPATSVATALIVEAAREVRERERGAVEHDRRHARVDDLVATPKGDVGARELVDEAISRSASSSMSGPPDDERAVETERSRAVRGREPPALEVALHDLEPRGDPCGVLEHGAGVVGRGQVVAEAEHDLGLDAGLHERRRGRARRARRGPGGECGPRPEPTSAATRRSAARACGS